MAKYILTKNGVYNRETGEAIPKPDDMLMSEEVDGFHKMSVHPGYSPQWQTYLDWVIAGGIPDPNE